MIQAAPIKALSTALAVSVALAAGWQARAGGEPVAFPKDYTEGELYATVNRGNLTEEIFTSRAAIDAVKNGKPIPSGTVITLVTETRTSIAASPATKSQERQDFVFTSTR